MSRCEGCINSSRLAWECSLQRGDVGSSEQVAIHYVRLFIEFQRAYTHLCSAELSIYRRSLGCKSVIFCLRNRCACAHALLHSIVCVGHSLRCYVGILHCRLISRTRIKVLCHHIVGNYLAYGVCALTIYTTYAGTVCRSCDIVALCRIRQSIVFSAAYSVTRGCIPCVPCRRGIHLEVEYVASAVADVVGHVPVFTLATCRADCSSLDVDIRGVNEECLFACWQLTPVPVGDYIVKLIGNAVVVYLDAFWISFRIEVSILILLYVNQLQFAVSTCSNGDRYVGLPGVSHRSTCIGIYYLVVDVYATLDIPVVRL